jgi:hypothetical protein
MASAEKVIGSEVSALEAIESAFHHGGYRINRTAAIEASREIRKKSVTSVLDSIAWKDDPPKQIGKVRPESTIAQLLAGKRLQEIRERKLSSIPMSNQSNNAYLQSR